MGDSGRYDQLKTHGEDNNECDHVNSTLSVRANRDVVPCCYDLISKLIMGNVNNESLLGIWNGTRYRKLRDSIESKNFYSICSNCAVVRPPVYLIPKWSQKIRIVAESH